MDSAASDLTAGLLKELECPVCLEYMLPTILMCQNGHNICTNCRSKLHSCPTCRKRILNTRNLALENLAAQMEFPCPHRANGCLQDCSSQNIVEHKSLCPYGPASCPIHISQEVLCPWNGSKGDLKSHISSDHKTSALIYTEMDTLSKDFLQELECPVCMEYMMPPITLCENGHSVCNLCRKKLKKCPICNGQFMNIRNIILENLAGKVRYPCKFRDHGCQLTFHLDEISKHQQECPIGHYKCPFYMTQVGCKWDGPAAYIKSHIKSSHTEPCDAREVSGMHKARLLSFEKYSAWCQTVFTLNEVFFRFSKTIDDFLYSCVLYVGPRENACKYNYRLTINTPDGKSSVSASHETDWYENGAQDLFENGKCAVFHSRFAKSCMTTENELILEEEIFSQPSL